MNHKILYSQTHIFPILKMYFMKGTKYLMKDKLISGLSYKVSFIRGRMALGF